MSHAYLVLSLLTAFLGLSWLAGMLRALYFYFRWLRSLPVWLCWLIILSANIGPLVCLFFHDLLSNIDNIPGAVLAVISFIGGLCMAWYVGIFGFIQMITLYVIGCNYISNFWIRLRLWHKILLIGMPLDMILWKLFF